MAAATTATLLAAVLGTIDQRRVHLIDMHPPDAPRNFIFRGNNPTNKSGDGHHVLDYKALVAAVRTAARTECSVTLPPAFRVV